VSNKSYGQLDDGCRSIGVRFWLDMKTLVCVAILYTLGFGTTNLSRTNDANIAFKHPASASDLNSFYRSIQALSADSLLYENVAAFV
jgi:hypothetical protein